MKNTVSRIIDHIEKALLLFIVAGTVYAAAFDVVYIFSAEGKIELGDLFLLFIYAEILGMVGAFYKDHRIPVTLPLIIAMTALTRMIVLQTKGAEPLNILYESAGIFILAVSAYIMSMKDMLSLKKISLREKTNDSTTDR